MFKVNTRNTRTKCEICSKLGIFIANFENISHLVRVSIVNFEQVNAGWDYTHCKCKTVSLGDGATKEMLKFDVRN